MHGRVNHGEMVGSIAAQSIGEPCTQMTLNSVDWRTVLCVIWTAQTPPPKPTDGPIGAFIDALLLAHPDKIQWQPDGKTAYLPLNPGDAQALSPDEHGVMQWTALEAVYVTPINSDGSSTLIRVTTTSGHEVTVTKGKSLLVERGGALVAIDGESVILGDRVPIVSSLPPMLQCDVLNLRSVFSLKDAIFTDEVIKLIKCSETTRNWFHFMEGRTPFTRGGIMLRATRNYPGLLVPGRVTTKATQSHTLPGEIKLDRDFGFFSVRTWLKGQLRSMRFTWVEPMMNCLLPK